MTPDVAALVEAHVPLATRIAQVKVRSLPAHVTVDEMRSAALLALVVSAQAFTPERGVPFGAFASARIRWALQDELRSFDHVGRMARIRARADGTERTLDGPAVSLQLLAEVNERFDVPDTSYASPETVTLRRERMDRLRAAVNGLPERLRTAVVGFYVEGRARADVAAELGVDPTRVSQMCKQALMVMREEMCDG